MRTTVDMDEDLIEVAKELAAQRRTTMSVVISHLVREALEPKSPPKMRNGIPLLTPRKGARKPTLALVNRLRDEE